MRWLDEKEEYYLFDLDNPDEAILTNDEDMGFLNDRYIYYTVGDKIHIYELDTKKELVLEIDPNNRYVYNVRGYKNFIYYELNASVFEEVMLWFAQFKDLQGENDND